MSDESKPSPAELEAYQALSLKEIARLVLCLLLDEEMRRKLRSLLPKADGAAS